VESLSPEGRVIEERSRVCGGFACESRINLVAAGIDDQVHLPAGAGFGATCPQASAALVNKMGKHARKVLFIEGFPVPEPLWAGYLQKLSGTERSNPDPLP
jgi:hypothetical protein